MTVPTALHTALLFFYTNTELELIHTRSSAKRNIAESVCLNGVETEINATVLMIVIQYFLCAFTTDE